MLHRLGKNSRFLSMNTTQGGLREYSPLYNNACNVRNDAALLAQMTLPSILTILRFSTLLYLDLRDRDTEPFLYRKWLPVHLLDCLDTFRLV